MFKMRKMKHAPLGVVIAASACAGSTEGQPGDQVQAGQDPSSTCVEAKIDLEIPPLLNCQQHEFDEPHALLKRYRLSNESCSMKPKTGNPGI